MNWMCLMLHYDVWQNAGGFKSLEESINQIGWTVLVKRNNRSTGINR
jgi:hypothetical protein